MEVLFEALLDTEWGIIIFGVIIIMAIVIGFFTKSDT